MKVEEDNGKIKCTLKIAYKNAVPAVHHNYLWKQGRKGSRKGRKAFFAERNRELCVCHLAHIINTTAYMNIQFHN